MKKLIIITLLLATFTVSAQETKYDRLYREGTEAIKREDYNGAIELFTDAISCEPKSRMNEYAYANLAYSYERAGNLNDAFLSYSKALEINPSSVDLLIQRAKILMMMDEINAALSDYDNILLLEPQNTTALFFRAYIYNRDKEYDKAIADYHTLLAIDPDNNKARLSLAIIYYKRGRSNEGRMLLEQLIEEEPGNAEYYIVRSNVERENKRILSAIMDAEKAVELAPKNAEYRILLAELFIESDEKKKARECLDSAVKLGFDKIDLVHLYSKCR